MTVKNDWYHTHIPMNRAKVFPRMYTCNPSIILMIYAQQMYANGSKDKRMGKGKSKGRGWWGWCGMGKGVSSTLFFSPVCTPHSPSMTPLPRPILSDRPFDLHLLPFFHPTTRTHPAGRCYEDDYGGKEKRRVRLMLDIYTHTHIYLLKW